MNRSLILFTRCMALSIALMPLYAVCSLEEPQKMQKHSTHAPQVYAPKVEDVFRYSEQQNFSTKEKSHAKSSRNKTRQFVKQKTHHSWVLGILKIALLFVIVPILAPVGIIFGLGCFVLLSPSPILFFNGSLITLLFFMGAGLTIYSIAFLLGKSAFEDFVGRNEFVEISQPNDTFDDFADDEFIDDRKQF